MDEIVVATTPNPSDDKLEAFAVRNEVGVFRGSEDDVLGRVLAAAEHFDAEVICEVTGDCPIIDPELVDQVVRTFLRNDVDYVNNGRGGLPDGMGAQVYSTEALRRSDSLSSEPLDREHVTFFIRRNPELFPAIYVAATKSTRWPSLGVTLDEMDDYKFIKAIIEHFGAENALFDCKQMIDFLRDHPELLKINEHVRRKGDT
jgi:spore coat polysaccharide biosynthesis protein SpsF